MGNLIKRYFKKIKKPDLYLDQSIRFLMDAKLIPHDSNDLIKSFISEYNSLYTIVVDDLEEKIKTVLIK